ncbi:hypothetical protein, partial [Hydrogenivirga sp. 128-5-R1-1]|uniref:hypothetical protein n=1 Tax=Hydrogenivirga sp. 128-5-R1-1 TaxID=392423 RepID=UPI00015EF9BC
KADLQLSVPFSRIYAKGSISKILKWGWQGDFKPGALSMVDSFIILDFAKEVKLYAGGIKVPFELHSGIQSGWSYVMPNGPAYGSVVKLFSNPFSAEKLPGSGSRSPQVGVWGKIAAGMLKYYLYMVDGSDRTSTKDIKTGYGVRIEFAPTMAGYKGHPGYVLKETYLGKQNTLSLGLSYATQKMGGGYTYKIKDAAGNTIANAAVDKMSAWAVDLLWEQNMGAVTPNISLGYMNKKFEWTTGGDDKQKGLIVQGQLLLNQKTILGKPAVGARYMQTDASDGSDDKESVIGVVGQLYVKGVGNRIALSVDRVKFDNGLVGTGAKDSYTDVTLALWYNF